MSARQRLIELVKVLLSQREVCNDAAASCLDCLLTLPQQHIPAHRSLRYFAYDLLDYFLGDSDRCELHHPMAAKYIKRWKKTWQVRPLPASCIPDHPTVVWTTDRSLIFEAMAGEGILSRAGLSSNDF